jgi:hypothetical protein
MGRHVFGAAFAAILTLSLGTSAVPSPTFTLPTRVASFATAQDENLEEIASADLNGDGNADIIETRVAFQAPVPTPIVILAGDGRGHFSDRTADIFDGPIPKPVYPRRTIIADFNGDGRSDVYLADTGVDSDPFPGWPSTLILSAPGGRLVDASSNLPRVPGFTHSAAAADVDGNGTVDLYAGNLSGPTTTVRAQILVNDGTGDFHELAGALPRDLTSLRDQPHYDGAGFVDVDGDHFADLVLVGANDVPDRLLLNDRTGHFHDSAVPLPPKPWGTANSRGLTVNGLDVDADGRMDLLLGFTKQLPYYRGRWIQVLINKGDATFADETASRLPQTDNDDEWPYSVQVADLNGDRKPDLGVSPQWFPAGRPDFYLNRGNGTFRRLTSLALNLAQPSFALLDANRDHRVDIYGVQVMAGGGETHFLSLQKPPPKPKPTCKRRPKPKGCP